MAKLSDFEKAVYDFLLEYKKAVDSDFVGKPISYALYQTWKKWDVKEKWRDLPERKVKK